jgi:hypothetical protein
MTMTMFRSRLVCAVFAAGLAIGSLAAGLLQPQFAAADPDRGLGLPLENKRAIAEIKAMLAGISKQEDGTFVFDRPVELRGSTKAIELLVLCSPDADPSRPTLHVCGKALFESPVRASGLVINDRGPQYPEPDFHGPALKVVGPSKFTGDAGEDPLMIIMPEVHEGPGLAVEGKLRVKAPAALSEDAGLFQVVGPVRTTEIDPRGIQLLVFGDPEDPLPSVKASFVSDSDVGSRLSAGHIEADTVQAFSIEETMLPPPKEDPGPF